MTFCMSLRNACSLHSFRTKVNEYYVQGYFKIFFIFIVFNIIFFPILISTISNAYDNQIDCQYQYKYQYFNNSTITWEWNCEICLYNNTLCSNYTGQKELCETPLYCNLIYKENNSNIYRYPQDSTLYQFNSKLIEFYGAMSLLLLILISFCICICYYKKRTEIYHIEQNANIYEHGILSKEIFGILVFILIVLFLSEFFFYNGKNKLWGSTSCMMDFLTVPILVWYWKLKNSRTIRLQGYTY